MKYTANCIYLKQNILVPCKICIQKLLMITFPGNFLIFICDCRHTIIISYALLTNNTLTSFDHTICNHKRITFLIICLHSVSMSLPFYFTFGLVNMSPSYSSRYFSLLMLACFYLFYSLGFLPALLLTSFHHHGSICLARSFVHP